MGIQAKAFFAIQSWDENTWDGKLASEVNGAKLTRAVVKYTYSGDIEGESTIQYLMGYNGDGTTGNFVALEQITGKIDGKAGSFTLQHIGTFDKERVSGTITIIAQSGTDELSGLSGTGSYDLAGHQEHYPLNFEYELAG